MLIDSYRSMIVRFALPASRGFLSPLLSLPCLVSSQRKKTSGTRVPKLHIKNYMGCVETIIDSLTTAHKLIGEDCS